MDTKSIANAITSTLDAIAEARTHAAIGDRAIRGLSSSRSEHAIDTTPCSTWRWAMSRRRANFWRVLRSWSIRWSKRWPRRQGRNANRAVP